MQTPTLVADGFTDGDAYGLAAANKECSSAAAIGSRADGKCQKCGAAAGYMEVHCWDDPTGLVRSRPKDFFIEEWDGPHSSFTDRWYRPAACSRRYAMYRWNVTSLEGLVQQLACNILPNGFWFYIQGIVPDHKDPQEVDRKLLAKYGIAISRQQRSRRKQLGQANLHYLRLGRVWFILATHGRHEFFDQEASAIRDIRHVPIRIGGYSLTVKRGGFLKKLSEELPASPDGKMRARVQIARERYRELEAYFLERACWRSAERLGWELWNLPFEPYAPVRRQLLNLLRHINQRRQQAGFEKIPTSVLRMKRRIVQPYAVREEEDELEAA